MTHAPVEALGLTHAEAELTVLEAMRHGDDIAIHMAQLLEPEEFYDLRRSVVFEAIRNILRGIEPVDTDSIVAECLSVCRVRDLKFRIDANYVEQLAGTGRRPESYAYAIKRLAWLRQAGDFAFWLVQELQARPDPEQLYTEAQERWQHIRPARIDKTFIYGWDTVKMHAGTVRERVRQQNDGQISRFDWPWRAWKNIRPLRPGFVGLLAAADGMGKTTYLECIAEHWAQQGWHVVYVHLEDAFDYKMDRRLARHSSVSLDNIEDGTLTDTDYQRIREAEQRMGDWAGCLHYYHAAGRTMTEIINELQTRHAEGVCQAVVFDYLDKVQPTRSQGTIFGDNTWERQAHDMEQLKSFCEMYEVPAMTATQGNKTMQTRGTQTRQSIQGSGQKSQKSQLVVILTRDLVGEDGLRDKNGTLIAGPGEYSPICKMRVDKQNRGKTHSFQQVLIGKHFRVADIERSEPAPHYTGD